MQLVGGLAARKSWIPEGSGNLDISDYLALALTRVNAGITVQGQDKSFKVIFNLPQFWQNPRAGSATDQDIFGVALGERLDHAKTVALNTNMQQKLSAAFDGNSVSFVIDVVGNASGAREIYTTITDVSQIRKRESVLRTLLLELSHRSKNLLAIVQSVATQSAKYSSTKEEFLKSYMGRLFAISGSQDLLVDSNWHGASLFDLARKQLELVAKDTAMKIKFEGEDVQLSSNEALHIGLALHELSMQAVTNPMWLLEQKEVLLHIEMSKVKVGIICKLIWEERPGHDEQPAPVSGFGSTLLEKIVPIAVNGSVTMESNSTYFRWSITFPLEERSARKKRHISKTMSLR
jgi:two-component sensor histidine kinase